MHKLNTIQEIVFSFKKVRSFDDLLYWHSLLPTFFQVWVVLGAIGVGIILFIFTVAFFMDKEN